MLFKKCGQILLQGGRAIDMALSVPVSVCFPATSPQSLLPVTAVCVIFMNANIIFFDLCAFHDMKVSIASG